MFAAQVVFRWSVASGGYRWVKWNELSVPPPAAGPEKGFDWVLTDIVGSGVPNYRREYDPFKPDPFKPDPFKPDTSALFRNFAEIEPGDREASVAFANKYGPLGSERPARPRPPNDARSVAAHPRSEAVLTPIGIVGRGDLACDWDVHPYFFRHTIRIWDLHRARDREGLSAYLAWEPRGATGRGNPEWVFDAQRGQTRKSGPTIREGVYGGHRWTGGEDVFDVAQAFLQQVVSDNVRGKTQLEFATDNLFHVIPNDLLTALWLQLGQAIADDKVYRQCKECGKWFEVKQDKRNEKRLFCTDPCKMKDYRRRKAETVKAKTTASKRTKKPKGGK
jgi:hypothetical protein